ncbi:MAG TPA: adenosylcobalamin-dependent ribonucleoside-diphosphate reductase, partial [Planctomycetota bacterium]|nr:adenosylcobalamin-dependent ribonucleoside-diphosphate reductase [Planctomycetota bacterium]
MERRTDGGTSRILERLVRPALGVRLSENARAVLEKRYLARDDHGRVAETPEELLWRVATHVAIAEKAYGADDSKIGEASELFYRAMAALEFLPNSPTLMNAGRRLGQCFACFVLPVADAITDAKDEGIFDAIRAAASIHQTGGGTGFSFSRLRAEGSPVASTGGRASGPVSFMSVFNAATSAIHQGGFRRGANMGILRVDHPDILDFVNLKSDPRVMTNFNLSVGITEEFLRAVRGNLKHFVVDPHTGKKYVLRDKLRDAEGNLAGWGDREWTARELFDLIVRRAWESGEPGLFFVDRVNRFNPTPQLGAIEASNPCAEEPLLPWEACNLGSINLVKFVEPAGGLSTASSPESRIRWKALSDTIALAVRFLDDVIDINRYPRPQIEEIVKGNRKIGLGVMGWADMLFQLGVRYDSEGAVALARTLMRFIKDEAWKASMELARQRGPFPNYAGSAWTQSHEYFRAPAPVRHAKVTTVAPTGTLSILAGCSAGIEPLFSLVFERRILNGERMLEVHPYFREIAEREAFASEALFEKLLRTGTCRADEEVPAWWRDVFACAHDVLPEWHMRMQAAFQESVDSGVSKTVNFPHSATPEDVRRVFELGMDLGVKGVTVYRDQSRPTQPMALKESPEAAPGVRRPVPDEAGGSRYRYPTNLGNAYITITDDPRGPREVFTNLGKCGSDVSSLAEALSRVISTSLGYGVPPEEVARQLLDITSQPVP